MKALVFGANGQDGHYLRQLCIKNGIEPVCISRTGQRIQADVSCHEQVEQLVKTHRPDYIFHIAANSTTRHDALYDNYRAISTGSINILESVRRYCGGARVFITGSGVQFRNRGEPISELDAFEASSAYALARIQAVFAARYFRSLGVHAYVGYLFHHESPLRRQAHISQKIVTAARKIAAGSHTVLELGDIDVKKEWVFAGDTVRAMFNLLEQDTVFETTIGSGLAYSIRDWLEQCFSSIGKNWQDYVKLRSEFVPEYRCLVSNPGTIHALGWRPETNFHELADLMMSAQTSAPA